MDQRSYEYNPGRITSRRLATFNFIIGIIIFIIFAGVTIYDCFSFNFAYSDQYATKLLRWILEIIKTKEIDNKIAETKSFFIAAMYGLAFVVFAVIPAWYHISFSAAVHDYEKHGVLKSCAVMSIIFANPIIFLAGLCFRTNGKEGISLSEESDGPPDFDNPKYRKFKHDEQEDTTSYTNSLSNIARSEHAGKVLDIPPPPSYEHARAPATPPTAPSAKEIGSSMKLYNNTDFDDDWVDDHSYGDEKESDEKPDLLASLGTTSSKSKEDEIDYKSHYKYPHSVTMQSPTVPPPVAKKEIISEPAPEEVRTVTTTAASPLDSIHEKIRKIHEQYALKHIKHSKNSVQEEAVVEQNIPPVESVITDEISDESDVSENEEDGIVQDEVTDEKKSLGQKFKGIFHHGKSDKEDENEQEETEENGDETEEGNEEEVDTPKYKREVEEQEEPEQEVSEDDEASEGEAEEESVQDEPVEEKKSLGQKFKGIFHHGKSDKEDENEQEETEESEDKTNYADHYVPPTITQITKTTSSTTNGTSPNDTIAELHQRIKSMESSARTIARETENESKYARTNYVPSSASIAARNTNTRTTRRNGEKEYLAGYTHLKGGRANSVVNTESPEHEKVTSMNDIDEESYTFIQRIQPSSKNPPQYAKTPIPKSKEDLLVRKYKEYTDGKISLEEFLDAKKKILS